MKKGVESDVNMIAQSSGWCWDRGELQLSMGAGEGPVTLCQSSEGWRLIFLGNQVNPVVSPDP